MNIKAVKFTRDSGARIANAVRQIERTPRDLRGRRLRMRPAGGGGILPVGERQYQVYQVVADNVQDFDDVRASPP